jgi:hypothetical protein
VRSRSERQTVLDLQRSIRPGLIVVCLLNVVVACSQRRAAELELRRIGVERLTQAADSLRAVGERSAAKITIPAAAWPEILRLLKPQAVLVAREGVFIRLESSFVTESGLLVAFTGVTVPIHKGTDPSFEHIEGRVYWYEIKG